MSNNRPINIYDSLLESIDALHIVDEKNTRDKQILLAFITFLSNNESVISKFEAVSAELSAYLNQYDFKKGYNFDKMQVKLQKLHPLRERLVRMIDEVKKLTPHPDRYNSKKMIEACRNFVSTCAEKLMLQEVDKAINLVDINTQKILDIQNLFARDLATLKDIHAMISANETTLNAFNAYFVELKQYVCAFPHVGQDDKSEVENRISVAQDLINLRLKVENKATQIKYYYNRYNKDSVLKQLANVLNYMAFSMRYSEVKNTETQLKNILVQISRVEEAFKNEKLELEFLKRSLSSKTKVVLWDEQRTYFLQRVTDWLKKDTVGIDVNLQSFKVAIDGAKQKRILDISTIVKRYPWLEKSQRYKEKHKELISHNITSVAYFENIKHFKRERLFRQILFCIPVLGWIILWFMD